MTTDTFSFQQTSSAESNTVSRMLARKCPGCGAPVLLLHLAARGNERNRGGMCPSDGDHDHE